MLVVILCSIFLVSMCVGIHYRSLVFLSYSYAKNANRKRWWINVMILGAMMTHIVEMELFAITYQVLCQWLDCGVIQDASGHASSDYSYFSFVVYTSLGFGDLTPVGAIRMMTALETLTGLVLIAWTASFLFVEMQNWGAENLPTQRGRE